MEEKIKGKFITVTKENGIKYKVYVPENVTADTPIVTYAYGTGDPGIEKCILENGSDSVFIMTIVDWKADLGTITMNIVNEVKQEYGITSTTVTPSGFSLGGFAGYNTAAENIRQNPDCEPQTVFLIDTYGTIFYNPSLYLNDTDTINLFKENQTIFFALDHTQKTTDINTLYAEAGLNIIQVKCIGQGHGDINASFFNEGMYDYMAGHVLPKDGYIYSIYNKETGKWEEIPYEKVSNKDELYSYFNIDTFASNMNRLYTLPDITIKSSNKVLETYLNAIRRELRNTSFLTANFNEASFDSTTKVPTSIPNMITEYFKMTSSLLNSIANKTTSIAKIAGEIDLLDKNMANKLDNINSGDVLYQISQPVSRSHPSEEIIVEEEKIVIPLQVKDESTKQKTENSTEAKVEQNIENQKPSNNNQSQITTKDKNIIKEDFPKYQELYSTDDKIVYNYNDEYKVIIHHEDGKVTGVEHYYDYKTTEDATIAVEQLKLEYKDNENFDQIVQKGQYVKVLFKEDMYKNITLDKVKENYKDLKEILK